MIVFVKIIVKNKKIIFFIRIYKIFVLTDTVAL